MAKRRHKARKPGLYRNGDGSTTEVRIENGERIEITRRKVAGRGEFVTTDRIKGNGAPAGIIEGSGLHQAPVIQTNPIPGMKGTFDAATGMEFTSRNQHDEYMKRNHLVIAERGDPNGERLPDYQPPQIRRRRTKNIGGGTFGLSAGGRVVTDGHDSASNNNLPQGVDLNSTYMMDYVRETLTGQSQSPQGSAAPQINIRIGK